MDEHQRDDQLLARAVQFLIDGAEEKAAAILLSCTLNYHEESPDDIFMTFMLSSRHYEKFITLTAPRITYDLLTPLNDSANYEHHDALAELPEKFHLCASISAAFQALLGPNVKLSVRASLVPITAQWREEALALVRGDHVTNQGLPFSPKTPLITWKNLRFRSQTEVRIAEALERAQVLFLPNCMARLGFSHRENREADFLICHKGKWGILEVDGPFHSPARKAEDDDRARLFKAHGIRLVEHFDAGECRENTDGVVKRFLYLLGQ